MTRFLVGVVVLAAAGCASTAPRFVQGGLRVPDNDYVIANRPGSAELIDASWRATNFAHRDGRPTEALDVGSYRSALRWTLENGRQLDAEVRTYDLFLSHSSNARVWIRMVPLPHDLRNKRIDVLAKRFVNGLSADIGTDFFRDGYTERRVATDMKKIERTTVFGRQAAAVTFEAVNLNQLELNPNAPRIRVELVLCEVPMIATFLDSGRKVRALPMIAYAHDAERFDEHLAAFHQLLTRLSLGKSWQRH